MEKLASALFITLIAVSTHAATIYVDANGSGDYPTIQAAIKKAKKGDIILLSDGVYTGDGNRDIDFLGKAITLKSLNGPNNCIIDCNGTKSEPHRGFYFQTNEDANSILDGLTVKNSYGRTGGAIYCKNADPTIRNCCFSDNYSVYVGGGICALDADLNLINCTFVHNTSMMGGAIYNASNSSAIINCSFIENTARRGGGMLNDGSNSMLHNCLFTGNSAYYHGGGILNAKGSSTLTNCSFTKNSARNGGGIQNEYSDPSLTNCTFNSNSAEMGGGMKNYQCNPSVTNCTFVGNSALSYGGGMLNIDSNPTMKNCLLIENAALEGGGIKNDSSDPTITNCTFNSNLADMGGGMKNYQCSPSVTNCTFESNSASSNGGGMLNSDSSDLTVSNCLFFENHATDDGGGMLNSNSSTIVSNCAFLDNLAHYGGGMNNNNSNPTINNCTFYDGSLFSIYNNGGKPRLTNCIIWGYYEAINYKQKHNISIIINYSVIKGGWPDLGNIDGDPCFVSSGYWDANGTPANENDDFWVNGDYHLLPESLCINAGDPNYTPKPNETDLDGLPRIIGSRIDMGCYEFNHLPVAVAGPNQTVYAFIDGLADVNLDGSASYDDDNDVLDYYWSWTIDGNVFEANGVSPTITLPVGQYQIELIVNDGFDDSEPSYCTIDVIEPLRTKMWLWPRTFNCTPRPKYITVMMYLPRDIEPNDVNNSPLTMRPCDVRSKYQRVYKIGHGRHARTVIIAAFDKTEICACLGLGCHRIDVAGRLQSGRYFYGSNMLAITRPRPRSWPFHQF